MDTSSPVKFVMGECLVEGQTWLSIAQDRNDDGLENNHNYIQWCFPLDEPSKNVKSAPVLTQSDINEIRNFEPCRMEIMILLDRMKLFYQKNDYWVCGYNHNHLRITRIIKSVRILVGDDVANEFKDWLFYHLGARVAEIDAKAVDFWRDAGREMSLATAKRRISKLSQVTGTEAWMPNLFIWVNSESTEQARARWEAENRPLTAADRVCYVSSLKLT